MNTRSTLLGSAMNFAHLAGLGLGKKSKAKGKATDDDQDDEKPDAADDDDEDKPKGKKAKGKADDDDDQDDEKHDASEDDDEDEPKGKKAKAKTADYRRGVAAERKRCAAIFGASAAARNIPLAASLAFETGMSAASAINVLKGQSAPNQAGADRSRRNPDLGPDGAPQGSSSKRAWGAAIDKVAPNGSKASGGWGSAIDRSQR